MKWRSIFIFAFLVVLSSSKHLDNFHKFKSNNAPKVACKRSKCSEEKIICGRLKNKTSDKSRDSFFILLKLCDVEFMKCQGYQVEMLPLKICEHQQLVQKSKKTRIKRELTSEEEDVQESPESVVVSMPGKAVSAGESSEDNLNENNVNYASVNNKEVDPISHEKSEKDTVAENTAEDKGESNSGNAIAEGDGNSDDENKLPETENNIANNKDITSNAASDNVDNSGDSKGGIENNAKDTELESKENKILSSENEEKEGGQDNKGYKIESDIKTDLSDNTDDPVDNSDVPKLDDNANVDKTSSNPDESKNNADKEQKKMKHVNNIGLPVDYDLKASNEGVDFDEYHKNCPTICPAREVMVCARCKDGLYRTFMSVCHLRMFNCKHPDEKAELVSRYPCVLSAPFLAEAPAPKGRVSEPGDKDLILQYIRCRENDKLIKDNYDPKCKFDNNKRKNI